MKLYVFLIGFVCLSALSFAQSPASEMNSLYGKYYKLQSSSPNSDQHQVEIQSDVDADWELWLNRGYSFGFNPKKTPVYTTVNGILSTPYMVQVRGNENEKNKKRWGYHVFEGYAKDDKSRITMLVNKHIEENKPVAEMYYYGTVYNHSEDAYNWLKLGSDVREHSFMFSRDKALFYGSLKLSNAFTLGNVGKESIRTNKPEGDDEKNYQEDAKYVNFKELREGGDGTMFYDKDNNIVVIKVNGNWMKLAVEPLPEGVTYPY